MLSVDLLKGKGQFILPDKMCSITESALDPAMAVSRLSLSESSVCKKCPSREVAVVLRGKDVYCRDCLLLGVQHKMRGTLGKHKGTPVNSKYT